MINLTPQNKYTLVKSERFFKDKTLVTMYNKINTPVKKKYIPFDYEGVRYRLNLESGELEFYNLQLCKYCLDCSVRRTRILLAMLLQMNDFDYFCTFTFNSRYVDRKNDEEVYKKFQLYLQQLKRKFPKLTYVIVPERHKVKLKNGDEEYEFEIDFDDATKGVLHFHMLLGLNGTSIKDDGLNFAKSHKVCCSWAPDGIASEKYFEKTKHLHKLTATDGAPIFNICGFHLGFTTASKIVNKEACNAYVAKYISKCLGLSTTKFKRRFWYSQNLDVPEIVKTEICSGDDYFKDLNNNKDVDLINALRQAKATDESVKDFYNKDYNVLQYWFDKDKYSDFENNRKKGLIPTSEVTPFDILKGENYSIFKT